MIVKKIKADLRKAKSKTQAAHIKDLTDYIREPSKVKKTEKVLYANGRGFICEDHKSQQAEMIALASEAVRSKNPVTHYLMSWHEDEQPSPEQVEQAVSLFMAELGLEGHQAIYALHKDTDNIHLHIAVNRVHPDTLKVIKPNKGFDIEAAHKAIAKIEQVQGWQREQNGRYQVLDNGELCRGHHDDNPARQPGQRQRDMENKTGEKSAERLAIEDGAPIIKRAGNWAQLHQELAKKGMRYEKTGSGATVFVGAVGVKASSVDREASLAKLQKRLGLYEPAKQPPQIVKRDPEPIKKDFPGWEVYIQGRKAHYAEKETQTLAQAQRHAQQRKQLADQQKAKRQDILGGNWKGKGELLNAMRSVLAAEQAAEKAGLKDQQKTERAQLRRQYRPYPDLEQWLRRQQQPELAEQWRYRANSDNGAQRIEGEQSEAPTPRDIRAYQAEIVGKEVHYRRKKPPGTANENADINTHKNARQAVAFADKGKNIAIYDWRNPEATLAALQLSAQKWGRFRVYGNDEYKTLCVRLAAEHGFNMVNPELQERIQQEREYRQQQYKLQDRASAPLKPAAQKTGTQDSTLEAYQKHYRDIRQNRQDPAIDLSRVDAMIAVRLRVTGHSQADIESALLQNAPKTRLHQENRDWQDYARRTTRYAFSAAGDRQAATLEKYRQQWQALEGREQAPQQPNKQSKVERGQGKSL